MSIRKQLGLTCVMMLFTSALFGQEVSIMTFNIKFDSPTDPLLWEERKDEVLYVVHHQDIIGFQEVLQNQLDDLVEGMPEHDFCGVGRDDGLQAGEYSPIFYNRNKYVLVHSETLWLSQDYHLAGSIGWDAELPRIATIAILMHKKSGATFRVINTHFSHVGDEARLNSALLLRGWIGLSRQDVNVIMGDFNSLPTEPAYNVLNSPPLEDAFTASSIRCSTDYSTYNTFEPEAKMMMRIDHIFTDSPNVVLICVDEQLKNGYYISDHSPVFMIVRL